jgi:hypothetical protein
MSCAILSSVTLSVPTTKFRKFSCFSFSVVALRHFILVTVSDGRSFHGECRRHHRSLLFCSLSRERVFRAFLFAAILFIPRFPCCITNQALVTVTRLFAVSLKRLPFLGRSSLPETAFFCDLRGSQKEKSR